VAVAVDDREQLVAEDQFLRPVGRDPEQAFRDLAIGAADADLEHAQADTVRRRFGDVADARRVRPAGLGDEAEHQPRVPAKLMRRMVSRVDVAIRSDALLGEGPRWDATDGRLLWVDIEGRVLHISDPAAGTDRAIRMWSRVGSASWTTSENILLVALADRLALLDLRDDSLSTLAEIPHAGHMRLNDGVCDPAGRFWVGSMALAETPGAAALYRFAGGVLERVLDDVTLSNGLGWSSDGSRMYYVDSPTQRIDVFDYDGGAGSIANRRPFAEIDGADGIPDGLAVDDDGCVWVALWGGRAVRRYSPEGALVDVVHLPAEHVTACCFGGDDLRSLFITTAAPDGSVFVTDAGVAGPPAQRFQLEPSSTAPSDAEPTSAR
jgi:sugar lactone lactonase YvrE